MMKFLIAAAALAASTAVGGEAASSAEWSSGEPTTSDVAASSEPAASSEAASSAASAADDPDNPLDGDTADKIGEWLSNFFDGKTVAMIMSWVAYAGTIIGLAAKLKSLHDKNQLTASSIKDAVMEAVDGKVSESVKETLSKYMEPIAKGAETTQEVMSKFAKIMALSQENTPEARIAILNLIEEMGLIGKDVIEEAKAAVEEQTKADEAKAAEEKETLEEIASYDGTSI